MFGKLLTIFVFIVASTFLLRKLELQEGFESELSEGFRGEPSGVFYDSGSPNRDNCEDCQGPCKGCEAGCTGYACGWNNSVSGDCRYNFAPEELKNKLRAFKYPHYYGYGTGSGFHYGEPYYTRKVDY